jgi:hypothetical protein
VVVGFDWAGGLGEVAAAAVAEVGAMVGVDWCLVVSGWAGGIRVVAIAAVGVMVGAD